MNIVISVLMLLLYGFLATAVFYSVTSYPKPNAFERVVQALIFTILIKVIVDFVFWILSFKMEIDTWKINSSVNEIVSFLIAISLGMILAYVSNNDVVHRILRKLRITKETSFPSEWYSAFNRLNNSYVVLHLKGERHIYGWPTEWPSQPNGGYFLIEEGEWLLENNEQAIDESDVPDKNETKSNSENASITILLPVSEVEMVEFVDSEFSKNSME